MRNKIVIVILIIASVGCLWFITYSNQKQLIVKVNQVDKIEKVFGNKYGFNTKTPQTVGLYRNIIDVKSKKYN